MTHFGQRNGAFHRQAHDARKRRLDSSSSSCFVLDAPGVFCSKSSPIVPQLFCSVILIVNIKLRLVEPFPEYPTGELTPSSLEQKKQSAERRLSRRAPYHNPQY